MRKIFSFLAAVLFAGSMMATTVTKTVAELATELSFTNSEVCTPFALDEVIAVSTEATDVNTGKYYSNGEQIRLYQTGAAKLILTAADGYKISSVTLEYASQNTGILVEAASGEAVAFENVQSATFTVGNSGSATNGQARITSFSVTYAADGEGGETPVDPTPTVLQAVSDSTTWDFSKITANTANALYDNEGIHLTDESTPSKNDEVIYADYSADFMTFAEDFNAAALAFKGEYPIRKSKYCQAGTLHFKADVAGTIVVKFSDTGSSASATAVKRYLVVNGVQTEEWTSRENNGETPYDAQLNVVSGKIAVPAGDVTITGSSAIVVYYVTFVPAQAEEPVLADPTNCAEAAEAALSVAANNELYNDGKEYSITGYVTSIQTAFNAQYSNISFWMADAADGGNVIQAYRAACASAEEAPAVGDKVTVTGKLTKYNSTPEFAAGCTYVIVEKSAPATNLGAKTIAEFLALKNTKDTCILTGVVANIANNVYGNFDLCNEADTVYIYGLLTPDGQTKQFESLNVAEKDTLTVLAIYGEYNGKPQVSNAIFVEVKKAAVVAQDVEVTLSSLTAPGSLIWTDATATSGWWQIMGGSDFYEFSLSNATEITEAAGTFTAADLDADYSYISIYGEKDTIDVAFVDGSVTVAVSAEGIVTVNGTLVGEDGNNYIFNLTYKDPTAEKTVNVEIAEWTLDDTYLAGSGLFGLMGQSAAGDYVQFYIWNEAVAGEYTEDDFDYQYFGSAIVDATAGVQRIFSATVKVTAAENGRVLVTADLLCYNNTLYKVTTTFGEGIDEVNAAVKATKTLKNGQLIIEKAGVRYNAQGAVIR